MAVGEGVDSGVGGQGGDNYIYSYLFLIIVIVFAQEPAFWYATTLVTSGLGAHSKSHDSA